MLVWINGQIVPAHEARVSVFDRGFLFGDGVYELVRFFNGVGVQMDDHVARLARSLAHARIQGVEAAALPAIATSLLGAGGLRDATLYLQVTRGAAATRAHLPPAGIAPTVVAMASASPSLEEFTQPEPVHAVLLEDLRWKRCDIKSISLMGNILALLGAADADGDEAILHCDGLVSEGTATNVFALIGSTLVTPPIDSDPVILHGVTRLAVFDAARDLGLRVEVRPLRVAELRGAGEIMVTSSRRIVAPVTSLDGALVGTGTAGPIAQALFGCARRAIAVRSGVALDPPPIDSRHSATAPVAAFPPVVPQSVARR